MPLAARLMLLITMGLLLASLFLAASEMLRRLTGFASASSIAAVSLIVAALNEDQLRAVLTMLETDALMLLIFVLSLRWLDRKPIRTGVALAFAFNIKYLSIVMLPYLLIRRRWTAAITMVLGSIAFGLLPALHLGWHEDLRCLQVSTAGLLGWIGLTPKSVHAVTVFKITDALSFSLSSGLARILAAHHATSAQLAMVLAGVAFSSLLVVHLLYRANGFSLWRSPQAQVQKQQPHYALTGIEWTMLIAATLSFSPQTNARHLILSILVNTPIVVMALRPGIGKIRWFFIAALAIIFFSFVLPTRALTDFSDHYGLPGAALLLGSLLFLAGVLRILKTRGQAPAVD